MIDFPASPVEGQTFTASNGVTYQWHAVPGLWQAINAAQGTTGTGKVVLQDSPELLGNPTAPTPPPTDNDDTIATTRFVQSHVAAPGKVLNVQYVSVVNRKLPYPMVSSPTKPFIVDGFDVGDQEIVHLINETDNRLNGPYAYTLETKRLDRIPEFSNGQIITAPYSVAVESGDEFTGALFSMIENSCRVGVDPNTWVEGETGAGELPANTSVKGGWLPFSRPRLGRIRTDVAADLWPYRAFQSSTTGVFQSIYLNLNRWGAVSRYIAPGNFWINRGAVINAMALHDEIVFDMMTLLEGQILGNLSRRTFHFEGCDWNGPNRIVMTAQNSDFADISGSRGFSMRGRAIIEQRYPRNLNSAYCIKGVSPFSDFTCEELWVGGFSAGILIDATHENVRIGKLKLGTKPWHQPDPTAVGVTTSRALWIDNTPDASLIGSASTTVDAILDLPTYQDIAEPVSPLPPNATTTLVPYFNSANVYFPGPQLAQRNIVLSPENVTKNAVFTITKTGVDAFQYNIIGGTAGTPTITSITTGQTAVIGWDALIGTGQWRLLRKFL